MRRTLIILASLALVFLFVPATGAFAALSCSQCGTGCTNYCWAIGSSCDHYASGGCFGGVGTCQYYCTNGRSSTEDCGCSSGSPIFKKKQPQDPPPPPNGTSKKQVVKKNADKDSKADSKDHASKPAKK